MPRIINEVPQTTENIIRPVALKVARDLAKIFNFPKDIRVLLPGVTEFGLFPNSALEENDPADPASFGHDARLLLEVSEFPVEDRILTTATHYKENLPFFMDKELNVRMYPIYEGTELTFNFTYRAENRTNALKFEKEILTRVASMREGILHELDYYYHVPYVFIHLMKHIHDLRENVAKYDETFDKWVSDHITDKATNITDQIGHNQALVIREFQSRSQGHFQFVGGVEPPEKDKETGTWVFNFQYKFIFDQVIAAAAEYPLLVHNQLVADLWRSQPWASGELTDPSRRRRAPSLSRYAMDHFTTINTDFCQERLMDGLIMPNFDEWRAGYVLPNTSSLFCAMMALDPTASSILFNLKDDLDGYIWEEDVAEFLKTEAPYMNVRGASVFEIRLYEGEDPMDDNLIVVNPLDLTVSTPAQVDLRKIYHVRLALVNDLFTLGPAAWDRLRNGGTAAIKILNCLQYKLLGKAFTPKLVGGRLIRNEDLRWIAQRINDLKVPHRGPLEYVMLTVNQVLIQTHRRPEDGIDQERTDGAEADGSDPSENSLTDPEDCDC